MLSLVRKRMKGGKGFTLIELLVVIIIIAILAAIAIPTFLGQRQKAQDAAAKSLVRNAMTALESYYVDARSYEVADPDELTAIEPSIKWADMADDQVVDATEGSEAITCADTALAKDEIVDFFGDDASFSIASISESDNLFGVYTDKGSGGGTVFVKDIGGTVTAGW